MYLYFDQNNQLVFNQTAEVMTGDLYYEPESLSYFARMDVQPTDTRKILINTLIKGLIINDIWNLIDILRLSASHDSQAALLNLKGDYWNGVLSGTSTNVPTFTVDRGFAGTTTTKWIITNFNPYNGGCNFVRDNAMLLVYNNTVGSTTYYINAVGCVTGGMCFYNNSAATYGNLNSAVATASNDEIGSRLRFKWLRRTDSTHMAFGTDLTPTVRNRTSANIIDANYIDCLGPTRQALIMIGASLNDEQNAIFQFFTLNYLMAIGANI